MVDSTGRYRYSCRVCFCGQNGIKTGRLSRLICTLANGGWIQSNTLKKM